MNNILQEGEIVPEATLEERVMKLERLVDMLLQRVDVSVRKKDWRRTAGIRGNGSRAIARSMSEEVVHRGRRPSDQPRTPPWS